MKSSLWAAVVTQVVAHRTWDREVPSSIPLGRWAFFLFSLFPFSLYQWCILNQVPRGATLQMFQLSKKKRRLSCAARGEAKNEVITIATVVIALKNS